MKGKILITIMALFMMLFSIGVNALDECTENNDPTAASASVTTVTGTTPSITVDEDQKWYNLSSVTIDVETTLTLNETGTLINGSNQTLDWKGLDTGTVIVYNSTGGVLGDGNYTVTDATGLIEWSLDGNSTNGTLSEWNNTAITITYNRTLAITDNLVDWTTLSNTAIVSVTASTSYGGTTTYTPLGGLSATGYADDINNSDWTVAYYYTTRDCVARDNCLATQAILFSAFGLMALFGLVGAAMVIFGILNGGESVGSLMGIGIGLIGLAIILFVGYIIISQVGLSVCTV